MIEPIKTRDYLIKRHPWFLSFFVIRGFQINQLRQKKLNVDAAAIEAAVKEMNLLGSWENAFMEEAEALYGETE